MLQFGVAPLAPDPNGCEDLNENCREWAFFGECKGNPGEHQQQQQQGHPGEQQQQQQLTHVGAAHCWFSSKIIFMPVMAAMFLV
jgi:hypothetical protein